MTTSPLDIRPFARSDRDQLTRLINAHLAAVAPGAPLAVQEVLSSLEGQPDEFIVDPWVIERLTLVAVRRGRIVAAAHLLRYGDRADVGDDYRNAGEIQWLLCWPDAPYWSDSEGDGLALGHAALARLERWKVGKVLGDSGLMRPGVYGVPDGWPHVRAIYDALGFVPNRHELVLLASVDDLPRPAPQSAMTRTLGVCGTRFTAPDDTGYLEIDTSLSQAQRISSGNGTADIGNLEVRPDRRRQGIGTQLLAAAAEWATLTGVGLVLAYAAPDDASLIGFLRANGFRPLTTTALGFRIPGPYPAGDQDLEVDDRPGQASGSGR